MRHLLQRFWRAKGRAEQDDGQGQTLWIFAQAHSDLKVASRARRCQGRSKFGPLRRSKSRPVGEGVAVFVGRLERSLRSPFRAAQA